MGPSDRTDRGRATAAGHGSQHVRRRVARRPRRPTGNETPRDRVRPPGHGTLHLGVRRPSLRDPRPRHRCRHGARRVRRRSGPCGRHVDGWGDRPALAARQPERLRSATVFCTAALGSWRLLNGDELPFDPHVWRRREQRAIDHAGRFENPSAHALADQSGLERGGELTASVVPTLVVEAPADPINPPPHTPHLAATIGNAAAGHDPTDGPCPPSRDPRTAGRHDPRPHRHRRRRSGTVTGQPPVCLALVACLRRSPGRIACKAHAGREISIVSSGRRAVDEVLERDGDLAAGVPMPQQYEVGYQPGSCQALGS